MKKVAVVTLLLLAGCQGQSATEKLNGLQEKGTAAVSSVSSQLASGQSEVTTGTTTQTTQSTASVAHDYTQVPKIFQKLMSYGDLRGIALYSDKVEKSEDAQGYVHRLAVSDLVDEYNELSAKTYSKAEVLAHYKALNPDLVTLNGTYEAVKDQLQIGLAYVTGSEMIVAKFGGIGAPVSAGPIPQLSDRSQWQMDGDRLIVPVINGKPMHLRLNTKQYDGGRQRSTYYVEQSYK